MSITVDSVFDLGAEEEDGLILSYRRQIRLTGLTSNAPDNYVNEIYASAEIPADGSTIVVKGQTLYLRGRSVDVGDDVPLGGAIVNLTYRRSEGSTTETGETPTIEVRGSLRQVERSKDENGDPYQLQYTWPDTSKAVYPNGQAKALTTERVSGTLRVLEPEVVLVGEVAKATNNPGNVVKGTLGRVNATAWQGEDPRHWLCSEAVARPLNLTTNPQLWSFFFGFSLDENGWDSQTTLVFIDPDTGQPPDGIAEGNGLLTVPYYDTKNFNEDF